MSARLLAALASAALLAACAGGAKPPDMPSDWEVENERFLKGEEHALVPEPPPYPRQEDLIPFEVEARSDNRFFVDRRSLSVDGRIVRYTLLVRSPYGVDNISFEALNCRERELRTYARGTGAGKWITRPTQWRKLQINTHLAQYILHREYFCPQRIAISDVAEGVAALEAGGHPRRPTVPPQ